MSRRYKTKKEYRFILKREYHATCPFAEKPGEVVLLGQIEYKGKDIFVFGSKGKRDTIPCLPSNFSTLATLPIEGFPEEWQEFFKDCKWTEYDHFEGFVLDNRLNIDHVLAMYRDQHIGLKEIIKDLEKDLWKG